MNKKGFTLVELIAVIVVLAILMIIAMPSINGVLSASKNKINEMNIKNIKEAGKTLGEEVLFCDSYSTSLLSSLGVSSCNDAKTKVASGVKIKWLMDNGYLKDDSDLKDLKEKTIKINVDDINSKISVDTSSIN